MKREAVDEYVPMLADSWTRSPDGRTYAFHIRQGAKFHNGGVLSAEDVAYTFQRGLLQGGSDSPQLLLAEAFFGVGTYDVCELIDESVCDDRAALQDYQQTHAAAVAKVCSDLKNQIVADNSLGTVTFHLPQPWGPLVSTLAGGFGLIIDKEWSVAQGAWDGSCSTWHNYYAATSSDSPLRNTVNGTGPFKLDHWTVGSELVLKRFDDYWNTVPLWSGGPFGPAAFKKVTRQVAASGKSPGQRLLDGEADLADSDSGLAAQLDAATLLHYTQPDGITPKLINPSGTIKKYTGGLSTSASDAFFNYDIATGGPINYIGSGALDGAGIPPNFFTDKDVRLAFNYAFDWEAYMDPIFAGSAVQRTGPIIKPLPGYDSSQPHYSKNLSLAASKLNQAWGGQVAANGFSMTIAYNSGSTARQAVANILKTNIESLNPGKYHINVISLNWSDFNRDISLGRIPIFVTGWMQDFPHPHNWVQPYLAGTFAKRQSLPAGMMNAYKTMIDTCITLEGAAARTCYEGIQNQTYQDAVDIFLAQGLARSYISANVQGYYLNPGRSSPRYYDLYKSALPVTVSVPPDQPKTLGFSPSQGVNAVLSIPAGSVSQEVKIVAVPKGRAFDATHEYFHGEINFELQAFLPDGSSIPDMQFVPGHPVNLSIQYGAGRYSPLQEANIKLLYFNGTTWEDASCGATTIDLNLHIIDVPICHLSNFALVEPAKSIFLPAILR